ncbi:MAG: competence/damage-inducible protein A [Acidobacteriota bacterium]
MNACIIAVGTELLTPFRVDTNSLFITERLNEIGVDVRLKVVAGDDTDEVADLFRRALTWADVVVATGGLGPTEDDITRDSLARALEVPLDIDESIVARIHDRFARRGMTMPDINRRQAMVPRGAVVLANPNGTAPGLWVERGRSAIVLLPGPPREMKPMFEAVVRERLSVRSGGVGLFRRVLRITGRTESDVDSRAQPVYGAWLAQPIPISTTILAVLGQIELHLTAIGGNRSDVDAALDAAVEQLRAVLGDSVYSVDGRLLEAVVGDLLRSKGLTIAVAESCTGGLLASRLTDVPGSSDYVDRGVVCYSNRAKVEMLGVPESLIAEYGAVSEPVASAMAEGMRWRSGAAVAVGVTGIAGPTGGTAEKPVGTVAIAVNVDAAARVRTFQFVGAREQVKFQAAQAALNMLRLMLIEHQAQ